MQQKLQRRSCRIPGIFGILSIVRLIRNPSIRVWLIARVYSKGDRARLYLPPSLRWLGRGAGVGIRIGSRKRAGMRPGRNQRYHCGRAWRRAGQIKKSYVRKLALTFGAQRRNLGGGGSAARLSENMCDHSYQSNTWKAKATDKSDKQFGVPRTLIFQPKMRLDSSRDSIIRHWDLYAGRRQREAGEKAQLIFIRSMAHPIHGNCRFYRAKSAKLA
jgi:hypothetical protein